MSVTDAKDLPRRRPFVRLSARVRDWLDSEHALTQRMAGMSFIIRVASAAVVFLSQVFLARWMGSHEFGTFVYVWTWLLLVADLIHLGLPMTAQRQIPEYCQQQRLDLLRGYLIGSRRLTFALATAGALAGAAIVYAIEGSLERPVILPLYLACVALPFFALSFMLDGIARSYNWIGLGLAPHSLWRQVVLIGIVVGMRAAGIPIDATTTMIALAVAVWTTTLLQLVVLDRRLRKLIEPGPRRYDAKGWLAVSLPVMAVWVFYTLSSCIDVLLLQQFRPSDEVAHYYAAAKTLSLVTFVHYSVAGSVAHRFSAYHVAGDREGLAAIVAGSVRWIFWPSLAATLVILAAGKPMLWLFGPNFVAAYPLMFVLAIGLLARAAVGPAERLLIMVGEQRLCVFAFATTFAVHLVLCLALAGPFGGMGIAAATSAAFVIESVLLYLIAWQRLGLHLLIWPARPAVGGALTPSRATSGASQPPAP